MRKKILELFGGESKVSPTITSLKPSVPITKAEKVKSKLNKLAKKEMKDGKTRQDT